MRRTLGLGLLVILSGGAASAQSAPPAGALEALMSCRSLTADAERLACFDRASGALAAAEAGGALVVVDRAKVESVRRQAFGFSIPSIADLAPRVRPESAAAPKEEETLSQIEAVVAAARLGRDGKWILSLDSGAVWRQTDTETVLRDPRAGSRVVIRAAALGSFLLSVDGQRSFRARREQ